MIPLINLSVKQAFGIAVVAAVVVMIANKTDFGKEYLGGGSGFFGL